MGQVKKIVVKGGGDNLFKVSEHDGWHYAYKVDPGFFSDSTTSLGKARSLADAIQLIRAYSGRDVQEISDY
jgi:hypothetical protein